MSRAKLSKTDFGVAAGLLAGYFVILLATADGVGFTRDEGYYFKAAADYNGWFVKLWDNTLSGRPFETFRKETIDRCFSYNHEHPALLKELFGFSWHVFSQKLKLVRQSTAFRFPGMFFGGITLALLYLFGTQAFNRRVGLFAALAMAIIPRFFFHSHLACFDVPITAMTLLVVYAYWLSASDRRFGWLAGVFFGLAIATKHNAWFIPAALLLHWAYVQHSEFKLHRAGDAVSIQLPPIPLAFVTMAVFGPLIMVGHWPYLWPAVGERLGTYFNFHLHHEHYPVSYFNVVYDRPPFPFHFVYVMTAITVPFATFVTGTLGFLRGWAWLLGNWLRPKGGAGEFSTLDGRGLVLLILVNALYPVLLFHIPGTPIFGGVKHWFPAMPFFMLLAGMEFDRLIKAIIEAKPGFSRWRHGLAWAAGGLILLPALLGNFYIHPYGTGFYNELASGVRGAADDEMQRKFWGYASRGVLEWLNRNAQPNARVCFHRTNYDSFLMYQKDGMLRKDIRYANDPDDADFLVFHYQKGFLETEYKAWHVFGDERAWTGIYIDEAPFVQVFKRRK